MVKRVIHLADGDEECRECLASMLAEIGFEVEVSKSGKALLKTFRDDFTDCLIIDLDLGDVDVLQMFQAIRSRDASCPAIFTTSNDSAVLILAAMRMGGFDVFVKPLDHRAIVSRLVQAFKWGETQRNRVTEVKLIFNRLATLTDRENEIMRLVVGGSLTKQIASQLGISPKTVEVHRSKITKKMQVQSVAQLVRLVTTAEIQSEFITDLDDKNYDFSAVNRVMETEGRLVEGSK